MTEKAISLIDRNINRMKEETARMAQMMQISPNQKCDSESRGDLPEAILKGYSKYEGSGLKSSLQCRLEHMHVL